MWYKHMAYTLLHNRTLVAGVLCGCIGVLVDADHIIAYIFPSLQDINPESPLRCFHPALFVVSSIIIFGILFFFEPQGSLFYFLLFVWFEAWFSSLHMLFGSFFGHYFYVHDARRVQGYISSGTSVGFAIGGLLVIVFMHYFNLFDRSV